MKTYRNNRKQITRMLIFLCLMTAFGDLQILAQTNNASVFSILPLLVSRPNAGTGIVIFNPTAGQVSAVVTAKNADGGFLSNSTVTIPPFGQVVTTAAQLFPAVTLSQGSLSIASATNGLVAYYSTFGSASGDAIEGAASATELLFPIVTGPSEGTSEINLQNPNTRPTTAELKLWSFAGNLLGISELYIPAGGVWKSGPNELFAPGTDFSQASHMTATSKPINIFSQAQSVAGVSTFSGFSPFSRLGADIGVLNARPLTVITNSGVVPYFRTGLQYASILCLASIEPASVNVTVSLMDNSGVSLGSRQLTLAGMGGIRAPIQNLFASLGNGEHEGWILIQSSGRVNANILFGRSDAGAFSAVPMQALPMANIVFPFAFNGFGASMELSLVNAGASPSGIGINVVQPSGVTLAAGQITLPPGSRISQNLHQLFPEIQNLPGGYIYLSASQPVFSTASLWSDDGTTVSNFIPQPLTTSFSVPALKSFAVTGKVTLNDTPTPGFPVVLSGPVSTTAVSDADGLYAFTGLPPGDYSVAIGQAGVEFVFAQVNFQITNASIRQDLQGYTVPNAIVVQPGSLAVSSPDAAVDIYGNNFSTGSQAFANLVRLDTTFVNSTHLKAVIPAYLLATPARLSISVATGDLVSQSFSFAAFQSAPTLTGIVMPDVMPQIFEGSPGATLTLNGTGFLPGLIVIVNGASDGIQVNVVNSTQALASVPASYFKNGGIYPVAVQNSDPSNTQSNVLLLTVYYPSPEVQTISPNQVSVELEPGLGPVPIEIFGFGFKRGAVAQFITDPKKDPVLLATSYCETDAYCLATHLYASIPANLLRQSGDVLIAVLNPSPTLGSSGAQVLEIRGLEPTITGVLPGSAAIRDLPGKFTMPVVINGTNFGPQTQVEVTDPLGNLPQSAVTVLSTTQLLAYIDVTYPDALGLWTVVVLNPGPGGGISSTSQFQILQENFVGNPFLFTVNPTDVAAGGPGFTLTITGMNFQSGAQVQFYSTLLTPTLVTGYVITVNVPANLIQTAGKFPISVANPGTGGNSNRLYLNVR